MCVTAYTVVLATKHVCDSMHCSLSHQACVWQHYFHPNLDDQCHPILEDINNCYFHPNLDDQCHPILDDINNCYFHPNLDDQCHPILDVNPCHPKLDGQFHPILDVYSVILSLYREIGQKTSIFGWFWCDQSNHPKMDDCWAPIIFHFWKRTLPADTTGQSRKPLLFGH